MRLRYWLAALSLAVGASADVLLVIRSAALLKKLLIDFHEIMRVLLNVMLPEIVDLILEVNRESSRIFFTDAS